ncbi:MAG: RNA 2',3'-cyclic phosphodiesterase [Gammaproteobacteria bacterium]
MGSTETERLFFALWPDAALRHTIYKATRQAAKISGGKPVPAENFHITLAFLGSLVPADAAIAREVAGGIRSEAFDLTLDRLGFWPKPRVVWLGASRVPEAAQRLARELISGLQASGLKLDIKPFMPHVTLARKVGKPGEFGPVTPVQWPATAFVLVRSVTHPEGSDYLILQKWPLTPRRAESME